MTSRGRRTQERAALRSNRGRTAMTVPAAGPALDWWTGPDFPALDLWADHRLPAPDTKDFDQRHQRGLIRVPWELDDGPDTIPVGTLLPAWICCGCGGAELTEYDLNMVHGCHRRDSPRTAERPHRPDGRCLRLGDPNVGEYAPYWVPRDQLGTEIGSERPS